MVREDGQPPGVAVGVSTVSTLDPNNGGREQYDVGAHCHPETTVWRVLQDSPLESLSSSHAASHGTLYSHECIYRHYEFKIPPSMQYMKYKTQYL